VEARLSPVAEAALLLYPFIEEAREPSSEEGA
jgi:hypothetical protein